MTQLAWWPGGPGGPASARARGQEARSGLRVGCTCLRNGQLFWGLDFGGDDDSLVLLVSSIAIFANRGLASSGFLLSLVAAASGPGLGCAIA
jgi:hypothetical protein